MADAANRDFSVEHATKLIKERAFNELTDHVEGMVLC